MSSRLAAGRSAKRYFILPMLHAERASTRQERPAAVQEPACLLTSTCPGSVCFFVIEHERRRILHCNVTQYPTAEWIVQQLREEFPEPCRYQYVILDRDRKFDAGGASSPHGSGAES